MKYLILFVILALSLPAISLMAQQPSSNGLIWEDEQYEMLQKMDYYPLDERGGDIPIRKSLKAYCPTPQDQGNIASCIGHALASTLTIIHAFTQNWENQNIIDQNLHSASYIFNQIKLGDDCYQGAYLTTGLQLLKQQGVCLLADFQNTYNHCHPAPKQIHKQKARPYRVETYEILFQASAPTKEVLDQIKVALAMNRPVIVGMEVPTNLRLEYEKTWTNNTPTIGHAMVIIGYDEKEKTLEFLNSYGRNWGNNGFFKLPYDIATTYIRYGVCLKPGEDFGGN